MTGSSVKSSWKPATRPGWWAVWLMAAYLVMYIITMVMIALRLSLPPVYGLIMLLCGFAAGVVALISIVKNHERAWLVWIALLVGAFVLFLLLGEFLLPLIIPGTAH
jgi:hypothetical protein